MSATVLGVLLSFSSALQNLQCNEPSDTAAHKKGAGRNSWSSTKARELRSLRTFSDSGSPVSHTAVRLPAIATEATGVDTIDAAKRVEGFSPEGGDVLGDTLPACGPPGNQLYTVPLVLLHAILTHGSFRQASPQ